MRIEIASNFGFRTITNFFPAGTAHSVVDEDGTVRECMPRFSSDISDLLSELGNHLPRLLRQHRRYRNKGFYESPY